MRLKTISLLLVFTGSPLLFAKNYTLKEKRETLELYCKSTYETIITDRYKSNPNDEFEKLINRSGSACKQILASMDNKDLWSKIDDPITEGCNGGAAMAIPEDWEFSRKKIAFSKFRYQYCATLASEVLKKEKK